MPIQTVSTKDMTTYSKRRLAQVQARYEDTLKQLQGRYEEARSARQAWTTDAQSCMTAMDNTKAIVIDALPKFDGPKNAPNWVRRGVKHQLSTISGADIDVQLKSLTGVDLPDHLPFEAEMNHTIDMIRLVERIPENVENMLVTGMGVMRRDWDTYDMTEYWLTGKPNYRIVNPLQYFPDPQSTEAAFRDRTINFEIITYPVHVAKAMFPEYADIISASTVREYLGNASGMKDIVNIVLCQWQETDYVPVVQRIDVEAKRRGEPNHTKLFFAEELAGVTAVPEDVTITAPFIRRANFWYQALWLYDSKKGLGKPVYIGERDHYYLLCGDRMMNGADRMPRGTVLWQLPMHEFIAVANTAASYLVTHSLVPDMNVESGALDNAQDWANNRGKVGNVSYTNAEWRKANPGRDAYKEHLSPIDISKVMVLIENAISDIKEQNGALDSARGVSEYSGQSGMAIARLQAQAAQTAKELDLRTHAWLDDILTALMYDVALYRNFPHVVETPGENFSMERVLVNDPDNQDAPKYTPENYLVHVTIEANAELQKQINREFMSELFAAGVISSIDFLRETYPEKAEQLNENAMREKGLNEIAAAVNKYPQLVPILQQLIAQAQQQEQPTAAAQGGMPQTA